MTHVFNAGTPKGSERIAAFDLDYTVIRTKSGKKFPVDKNDWILMPKIKDIMHRYKGYKIVIISNQGYKLFSLDDFKYKLCAISNLLGLHLQVFVCTEDDNNRKPRTGMWTLLQNNNDGIIIDKKKSFYMGDAAGRSSDFSDSDLKFALNVGIPFYTEDDVIWTGEVPKHPLEDVELRKSGESTKHDIDIDINDKEMLILVGSPACGKSTLSTWINNKFGYIIINQDILVTKSKVIAATKKALITNKSIVIDRKNEYIEDRKLFIDMATAAGYNVRIIFFDVPRALVEHLSMYRYITEGKSVPTIVYNKYYSTKCGLEPPTDEEAPVTIMSFKINEDTLLDKKLFYSYLV